MQSVRAGRISDWETHTDFSFCMDMCGGVWHMCVPRGNLPTMCMFLCVCVLGFLLL